MASEYGVEFSDEELSMINGGGSDSFQTIKDYMLDRMGGDNMKRAIVY